MQTMTTIILSVIASILTIELFTRFKKRKWGENP